MLGMLENQPGRRLVFRKRGLRGSQEAEHVHLVVQDKDFAFILGMIGGS